MADQRLGKLLREGVEAAPFDDAPRLVYADHLLEKRDPRGAFIQLGFEQSRRAALGQSFDDAQWKQFSSLLKVHERSWLGPVMDVSGGRIYDKGFLDSCFLLSSSTTKTIEAARGHRVWSTVRSLDLCGLDWGTDYVLEPCMRGLRRIREIRVSDIAARLANHNVALGIEEIALSLTPSREDDFSTLASSLGKPNGLRHWRRLELQGVHHPNDIPWAMPLSDLDVLRVAPQWPRTLPIWLANADRFAVRKEIDLGLCALLRDGEKGRFTVLHIRQNPRGDSIDFYLAEAHTALEAIPSDALTNVEATGIPDSWVPRLREALQRQRRLVQPPVIDQSSHVTF